MKQTKKSAVKSKNAIKTTSINKNVVATKKVENSEKQAYPLIDENISAELSNNDKIEYVNHFLIDELVYWYVNYDSIQFTPCLSNRDITVFQKQNEPNWLIDITFLKKEKNTLNEAINVNNESKVLLHSSILTSDFLEQNFVLDEDLKTKGYKHHYFLSWMLYELKNNLRYFLKSLYKSTQQQLPKSSSKSVDKVSVIMLERFSEFLAKMISSKKTFIPELSTYSIDTSIMSARNVNEYFDIEIDSTYIYRYIYSETTSLNFTNQLKEIIDLWLKEQKYTANDLEHIVPKYKKGDYSLPLKVMERLDFITDFYRSKTNVTHENNLSYNKGQIMYLIKLLEKKNIIPKNKSKEVVALGISLLTGISVKKAYELYPASDNIDFNKLFDGAYMLTYKKQLLEILNTLKEISESEFKIVSSHSK